MRQLQRFIHFCRTVGGANYSKNVKIEMCCNGIVYEIYLPSQKRYETTARIKI